jgi:ABC-type bacteriocin/lantibiotic exporter with double-glycine peptidase domain
MLQKASDVMSSLVQYAWIFAVLGYGGMRVTQHRMTLGMLTAFLLLSNILFKPFMTLLGLVLSYQDVRSSLRRIVEYRQDHPYVQEVPSADPRPVVSSTMELRDVSFRYAQTPILERVNLSLAPHRITALVGASGAGKTTLCKLLVRLHDPSSGCVLLDGRDVREMSLADLRREVFVSLQGQYVFNGTLWENLTYGAGEVTRQEALLALKQAGLQLSRHFPSGWESRIGERGINLSVGETQRVAIARAFLSRPRVCIFDEAMAHLDGANEEIIQESLQQLKAQATVLLVTHRYSTLRVADDVAILEGGKLVEHRSLEAAIADPSSALRRFHATSLAESGRRTELTPDAAA